jgi:hypothetical protein
MIPGVRAATSLFIPPGTAIRVPSVVDQVKRVGAQPFELKKATFSRAESMCAVITVTL